MSIGRCRMIAYNRTMRVLLAKPEKGSPLQTILILVLLIVPIAFIVGAVLFVTQLSKDSTLITPEKHIVGNLSAASATIAWTTPSGQTIGSVIWGTSESLSNSEIDLRNKVNGQTEQRYTHIVTLDNLSPNTTYYYRIKVGSIVYPSADEAPYSFTTLPLRTQSTAQAVSIYGNITQTTIDDIIVTASVNSGTQTSYPLITYPKNDGSWYIDISKAVSVAQLQPITVTSKHNVTVNFDSSKSGNSVIASPETSPLRTSLIDGYTFNGTAERILPTATPIVTAPVITPSITIVAQSSPTPTPSQQFTSGNITQSGTGVFNFAALKQDIALSTGQSPTVSQNTPQTSSNNIVYSLYKVPVMTNITDTSSSVFWVTEAKETSDLVYSQTNSSGSTKLIDDRDSSSPKQYQIHHVTLKRLTANTSYSYSYGKVTSPRQFTSPKPLQVQPAFQNISGTLNTFSGECILLTQLSRGSLKSSKISTILQNKDWILNIGPVRKEDLSEFFAPQANDNITFDAYCIQQNGTVLSGSKMVKLSEAIAGSITVDIQ